MHQRPDLLVERSRAAHVRMPDDPDHFCRWLDERAVTPLENFAPRLAYGRYLQEQLAVADVRIETAEVVGWCRSARTVALSDGRSLSADAVVLASGRPKVACPTRWNVPSPGAGRERRRQGPVTTARWWWIHGHRRTGSAWCARPQASWSSFRAHGVDVALHLIARGATVTLLSRHGVLPADSVPQARRQRFRTSMHSLPRSRLSNCAPLSLRISRTRAQPVPIGDK